jgi:hypothetical protein
VVLIDFLRANADIFAWSPSDMPGIPREVAEHSLDILPHSRAVQQRLRRFDEEWRWAIGASIKSLIRPPGASYIASLMPIPGTTKSR